MTSSNPSETISDAGARRGFTAPFHTRTYLVPEDFLLRAQPFLEARETVNSLILGVAIMLHEHPDWAKRAPFLATIDDSNGRLALTAAITPPLNLLLAGDPQIEDALLPAAVEALIPTLQSGGWQFPGVNAEARFSTAFAGAWSRASNQAIRDLMRLRLFELREVIPPPAPAPGWLREGEASDLEQATAWLAAFNAEALGDPPDREEARRIADRRISNRDLFIWEDDRPVSMAMRTRPTPRGVSIGGVYTPPGLRRRGYASACVAALSQRLLDSDKSFTSLFTDLSNPTSNAIYQRIGYRPVSDFIEYRFS